VVQAAAPPSTPSGEDDAIRALSAAPAAGVTLSMTALLMVVLPPTVPHELLVSVVGTWTILSALGSVLTTILLWLAYFLRSSALRNKVKRLNVAPQPSADFCFYLRMCTVVSAAARTVFALAVADITLKLAGTPLPKPFYAGLGAVNTLLCVGFMMWGIGFCRAASADRQALLRSLEAALNSTSDAPPPPPLRVLFSARSSSLPQATLPA
jgi:hypothetical protein